MNRLIAVFCGVLLAALPSAALADTVYTYTGSSFQTFDGPYNASDFVSGSFTVSSPLAPNLTLTQISPVSFSFTNGVDTFTDATSSYYQEGFGVSTDANGNIVSWTVQLQAQETNSIDYLYTVGFIPGAGDGGAVFIATNDYSVGYVATPGTWTESTTDTSAVPEPSSLVLIGTGLVGVFGAVRRRVRG